MAVALELTVPTLGLEMVASISSTASILLSSNTGTSMTTLDCPSAIVKLLTFVKSAPASAVPVNKLNVPVIASPV